MAVYCSECGKEITEGVKFCTECGAPIKSEPAAAAVKKELPPPEQQSHIPPPPRIQTVQAAAPTVPIDTGSPAVSTGTFFGLQFLFAVPVIGWLACLIMAFAPKNKNIKHYARAMLIWLIIGIVLSAGMFFVLRWAGGVITEYISEITDGAFGEWGEILEQFKELGSITDQLGEMGELTGQLGEIGDIMGQLNEGGLEGLPTE